MITSDERSDLIYIMKMNRLNLVDSDSAQMEFIGFVNDKDYRVSILAVENSPQLIIESGGEVICYENLRSIDDLKTFLDERLYRFFFIRADFEGLMRNTVVLSGGSGSFDGRFLWFFTSFCLIFSLLSFRSFLRFQQLLPKGCKVL